MIEIILALLALLGNCGWFISGRLHRQQVRQASAQAQREELDVSVQYVKQFKENIYDPLQKEVRKLRATIEAVGTCEHRSQCPALDRLQHHPSPLDRH